MKSLLAGLLLMASMSSFADPIIDCDEWALSAPLQHKDVLSTAGEISDAYLQSDKIVYLIPVETELNVKIAAVTTTLRCRVLHVDLIDAK